MSLPVSLDRPATFRKFLRQGLLIGTAGGLAEVAVVALYAAAGGPSASVVANGVSEAVGLHGYSAWDGLLVHMLLSLAVGLGLAFMAGRVLAGRPSAVALYGGTPVLLAVIWAFNFFVLLPWLSPSFVTLLPLAVTLLSKLAFGVAAGVTTQALYRKPKFRLSHAGWASA